MSVKSVAVSADNVTYYNLPGSQGSMTRDGAAIDDTIFGQSFKSQITGIITWGMEANAVFKGYPGYKTRILKMGTPTAFTTLPATLVSGKTYRLNDAAKRIWDRTATFVVYDNAVDHTADVASIDYLFGKVTFNAGYTVTGAVTIDGEYFPTANLGSVTSFTLTQSADAIDTTTLPDANTNGGYKTHIPGLRTVTLDLPMVFNETDDWATKLTDRDEVIIEISPDGNGLSMARGFFRLISQGQSGNVGALEEETLKFALNVPYKGEAPLIDTPFAWNHDGSSPIPVGIKTILDAWEAETMIYGRYLWDGVDGYKGQGVVSNFTLTGGMEAMNSFAFTLTGSGAMTSV